MYYIYGLAFCYSLPTMKDFPTNEDNRPKRIIIAQPNEEYKAYAYYSRPLSIVDEKVYHLEYIGRGTW